MDHFKRIPEEKQRIVINAAIQNFGANGYRKASMSDIAVSAGISKSMVFHYFGSKKALYLYLFHFCTDLISSAMTDGRQPVTDDFFERLTHAATVKLSLMTRYPAILFYLNGAYTETAKEVVGEIKDSLSKNAVISRQSALDGIDITKFKPGIDPGLVFKIIGFFTEGYLSKISLKTKTDIDAAVRDLDECINLMKSNFYREECL